MSVRTISLGAALVAACALLQAGGASAADSAPPCAAAATMRPSLDRAEDTLDESTKALVATHPIEVDIELAPTSEDASVSPGPVTISGPSGVVVKTKEGSTPTVTAPTAGAIPLTLTWDQDDHGSHCTATGQVTLPIVAAKPALVGFKKTFSLGSGGWRGQFSSALRRPRGGDASPVRVVVRVSRRGTLRPPRSGKPLLDARVEMGAPASGVLNPERVQFGIKRHNTVAELLFSGTSANYKLYANARLPSQILRHFRMKFGLAVDVTQSGRRIGGMSSGVSCRERRSGGHIKGFICSASGFRAQP